MKWINNSCKRVAFVLKKEFPWVSKSIFAFRKKLFYMNEQLFEEFYSQLNRYLAVQALFIFCADSKRYRDKLGLPLEF